MLNIILEIYTDNPNGFFTYDDNLPDDAPDTLIHSAVRDAVNRFIVERGGTIMDPVGKVTEDDL